MLTSEGETLRCLYCGNEYWLPSRIRRDPDFCSPEHREKYNNRVNLAMRRVQESSGAPLAEPAAALAALDPQYQPGPVAPRPGPFQASKQLSTPRMAVRPIFDRVEEKDQSTEQRDRTRPAFTEIFHLSESAANPRRNGGRRAIRAIAAAVAVGMALWLGAPAGKFAKEVQNHGTAEVAAFFRTEADAAGTREVASTAALTARPEPSAFQHPVDWIRTMATKRATTHLAESFDNGMAAWGVKSKGWAPGWLRNPDGYVRPGQLALFQPSLNYADYRMDFFGQIENDSLGWVVRGKDTQNYYAMKVNIMRPGLRPMLSMEHYPVVHGEPGHKVELPLSVMIHNGRPYHVSVEVYGSHYNVSIEEEEVDSWSDDTLLAGGVGFFSETGARARIYWMEVSQNDDWLGRLCRRIADGGETRDTAWFEHLALPSPTPATATLWP